MAATPIPFSTKDSASGQLNAGITAVAVSIPLKAGNGANFPQPYTGSATSGGTAVTLNSTGISAAIGGAAAVGKWIWNKTDASVAVITAVDTNAVTTTRLLGGTDNLWDNGDVWCIDPFVATFAKLDANGDISTSEEALIIARSTDTLTVATAGRGYNGTVATTFDADDYVYLFVTSPIIERIKDIEATLGIQINTNVTNIAAANTNIGNLQTGAYPYVAATGSSSAYVAATPALAAYAAGNIVRFKANHDNTGAATLAVNSLAATAIKKLDGATDLSANDIKNGQIVTVVYDGTNFQMLSPVGTVAANTTTCKTLMVSYTSSSTLANPTSATAFDEGDVVIASGAIIAGRAFEFEASGSLYQGYDGAQTFYLTVALGTVDLMTFSFAPTYNSNNLWVVRGTLYGTAAAGAAVAVRGSGMGMCGSNPEELSVISSTGSNIATNAEQTFQIRTYFGTSAAGNTAILHNATLKQISPTAFTA